MIPKIIHLIWFGSNPYPKLVKKCVNSWKKIMPDYEIKVWNENNFDITCNYWVKEAYDAKKYAFVADYVRFNVLSKYGGVYIETDMEVLKSFDSLLINDAFIGFTNYLSDSGDYYHNNKFNVGVLGTKSNGNFCNKMREYYENRHFLLENGSYDIRSINSIVYEYFLAQGLNDENTEQVIDDVHIYPASYFIDMSDRKSIYRYIDTAYSIHYGGVGYGWGDLNKNPRSVRKLYEIYMYYYWNIIYALNKIHMLKLWNYIEDHLYKSYLFLRRILF